MVTRTVRLVSSFYFLFFSSFSVGDGPPSYGVRHKAWLPLLHAVWHSHTRTKEKKHIRRKKKRDLTDFKVFQSVDNSVRVSFFCCCVFLYNPNFFQMLPTAPYRIFVIFFFLFVVGGRRRRKKKKMMMMMCVPHFFRVLWRASFFFFLSRPSLLRRLVIHSRGAHPTTTTRLLFFLFFSFCVQIEERKKSQRERERETRSFYFFPPFYSLVYVHKICSGLFAGCRRKSWVL